MHIGERETGQRDGKGRGVGGRLLEIGEFNVHACSDILRVQ